MNKYVGFIEPEIVLEGPKQHWVLGASNTPTFPTLKEDGNWETLLPTEESQNKGLYETFNCTSFNTLNPIETIIYNLTGERVNYSDRWVGIIAGTKAPGNDPHVVAEAIRKYGLIPEEMLPFSDDLQSIDEYYSFKGADKEACYRAGREWLEKFNFAHSWVFTPGQPIYEQMNNMKVALKNSPLAIAVFAWASDNNDVYYKNGPENHWTSVYNVDDLMRIFDSYPPFKKKVKQDLRYCKRYSITLKESGELTPAQEATLWTLILDLWNKVWGLKKQIEALPKKKTDYDVVKEEIQKEDLLDKFCQAIKSFEGYYAPGENKNYPYGTLAWKNKNPGNLKSKSGTFMKFATYEEGYVALKNYVIRACTGKHAAYSPDYTILKFFLIYAPSSDNNYPSQYADFVAKKIGKDRNFLIKNLL